MNLSIYSPLFSKESTVSCRMTEAFEELKESSFALE